MQQLNPSNSFGGVYAATICPMTDAGTIDQDALWRHLSEVGAADGLAGFLVNGHAGENFALDRDELMQVIRVARDVSDGHCIVAGINSEQAHVAARMSEDAAKAGADAVMVFPPFSWALGADDRLIQAHHRTVANASGLPLFLFQGSVNAGRTRFEEGTLRGLLEIDSLAGIKEGSWEAAAYEETRRLAKSLRPDVGVMASGDEHLFVCFMIGSEGSLVSLAAVVPDLIVALERAVAEGDIDAAQAIHERLYHLARLVYAPPGHLATLRLKICLKILGRLSCVSTRMAMPPLSTAEIEALRQALIAAGCLRNQ